MHDYFQITSLASGVLFFISAFVVGLFAYYIGRDFEAFKKQIEIASVMNIFYSTYYIGGIWFTTELINSVVRWANEIEKKDIEKRKRIDFMMQAFYSSITKESSEQTFRLARSFVDTYNEKKTKEGRKVVFVTPNDEAAYQRCLGFPARYAAYKAAE